MFTYGIRLGLPTCRGQSSPGLYGVWVFQVKLRPPFAIVILTIKV